jgi:CPA2 family monovalent cation:H+ antiporter-2
MHPEFELIPTLAAAFVAALLLGYGALRLGMPTVVGYIIAGTLIGPYTPGFVGEVEVASQLAEVGVILLMFGVGLHFSMAELRAVKGIAVPGALVHVLLASAIGAGLATLWDWPLTSGLIFGICLSAVSTIVLQRTLEALGQTQGRHAHIAIGWLIVEDLMMVLVLVLIPTLAGDQADQMSLGTSLLWACVKIIGFAVFMSLFGRHALPRLLHAIASTGSKELFTLTVMTTSIGLAFLATELFDVSMALGAFFAGMMMRESGYSLRAAEESLPLRDAFAVLFFVSVGMLFDPAVFVHHPVKIVLLIVIVGLVIPLALSAFARLRGLPWPVALSLGFSLAQVGEFAFILSGLSETHRLLPEAAHGLILAVSLVSITLHVQVLKLLPWATRRFSPALEA